MHGCQYELVLLCPLPIVDRKRTSLFRLHFQCLPFAELVFLLLLTGRSAAAALDARSPPQTMITPHAYISALFVLFLAGNPVLDYQPISSLLRQFRFVRFLLPTPYRVISYYTTNGLLPSPAESAAVFHSKSRRQPQ